MKKLFMIAVLVSFCLMPVIAGAQSGGSTAGSPPVNQALVPEGFFAIKLADALKLSPLNTEAEAETTLTSLGIVPKNGWIADYPVTPDVLIELQKAAGTAADSGKLSMSRDEVTKAVQSVAAELGLPPVAAEGQGSQSASAENDGEYSDPSEVNNYYESEGPPVVTYYPPPPDYDYLYAWVPSPFWCAGFFFPGFFVLNDFDTIVIVDRDHHHRHHHHDGDRHHVTNHVIDPKTHRVARIDPVTRTIGRDVRANTDPTQKGFNTNHAQKSAATIFNRSLQKTWTGAAGKGVAPRTNVPAAPSASGHGTGRAGVGPQTRSFSPAPPAPREGSSGGRSFEGSHGGSSFGGFSGSHGSGPSGGGFAGRSFGGGGGCRGRC